LATTVAIVGVALLVAVVGSGSHDVLAHPEWFVFTPLVFLGTPIPQGGDTFLAVFESNGGGLCRQGGLDMSTEIRFDARAIDVAEVPRGI
jgi:hypothetical protein